MREATNVQILRATMDHIDCVAPLFNAYRVWYGKTSDLDSAKQFLCDRIIRGEAAIFLAARGENPLGFTLLYPGFSSVSMGPIWVLNDLFVVDSARGQGVGASLLQQAYDHAAETGAIRLELETDVTNATAQSLYESRGWRKIDHAYRYELEISRGG